MGFIDDELAWGLGGPAAAALAEMAQVFDRDYVLVRWLVNGRSRAPVAIVRETDVQAESTRLVVLKVPGAEYPDEPWTEVMRHKQAWDQAPPQFRADHLSKLAPDPQRVGDGSWLVLQEIAGDDSDKVEVLTVLLNTMLDGAGPTPEEFARACGEVVRGILSGWAGKPHTARAPWTVRQFLLRHVLGQLEPGGRLHALSLRYPGDTIEVPGEPAPLANPFALARGAYYGDSPQIPALIGRTHGDLHTDNVLVATRPLDGSKFHLIDLALYEPDGPVTRDPAHMVLYILARRMDALSALQQSALLDVLLAEDAPDYQRLPGWLASILREVDTAFLDWLSKTGLQPDWRRQRLLSLAACAMLFLGRKSTRPEDYPWFLRLAARAADKLVTKSLPPPRPAAAAGRPPQAGQPAAGTGGLSWRRLAEPLPATWAPDLDGPRVAGIALLEVHVLPVEGAVIEAVQFAGIGKDLAARAALVFDGDPVAMRPPSTVTLASGAGFTVTPAGQRSAWQPLPRDAAGAVLDVADLTNRIAALLPVLSGLRLPGPAEVGFAVGITSRIPVAAGKPAELPRTTRREPSTESPVRVAASDALPFTRLREDPVGIAAELAARVMLEFQGALPGHVTRQS